MPPATHTSVINHKRHDADLRSAVRADLKYSIPSTSDGLVQATAISGGQSAVLFDSVALGRNQPTHQKKQ